MCATMSICRGICNWNTCTICVSGRGHPISPGSDSTHTIVDFPRGARLARIPHPLHDAKRFQPKSCASITTESCDVSCRQARCVCADRGDTGSAENRLAPCSAWSASSLRYGAVRTGSSWLLTRGSEHKVRRHRTLAIRRTGLTKQFQNCTPAERECDALTRVTTLAAPHSRQVGCNTLRGVHSTSNFTYPRIKPTAFYDTHLRDSIRPGPRACE